MKHTESENIPNVLLVVDAQQGLINEHTEGTVPYISELMNSGSFTDILTTRFINTKEVIIADDDYTYVHHSQFREQLNYYDMDLTSSGFEYAKEIEENCRNKIDEGFIKYGYGDASEYIAPYIYNRCDKKIYQPGYHIEDTVTVTIVGFDTESCAMSFAYNLFDKGFHIVIDSKGCASSSGYELHEAALKIMQNSLGKDNVLD